MSSRRENISDAEEESFLQRSDRSSSPPRGNSFEVDSKEENSSSTRGSSPIRSASYRVRSPVRGGSPVRIITSNRGILPTGSGSYRVSSPERGNSPGRITSNIIRRPQNISQKIVKTDEEKKFEEGISVGKYNISEIQERKMSNIAPYLPSVISQLSLGLESGFTGQLTTVIKESFRYLVNLPGDRIVTSNNRQLKIWYTPTDELLLTINASPPTNKEKRREKLPMRQEEGEDEEQEQEEREERKRREEREEEEAGELIKMKFFDDRPVICGNKIIIKKRYQSTETFKWMNTLVVYDSETGNILNSLEDTGDVISNMFSMSDDTVFFSSKNEEMGNRATTSCYIWNVTNNQLDRVIPDPYAGWGDYIRVILLPGGNFALFHKAYLSFFDILNLTAPYMLVSLEMGTNMTVQRTMKTIRLSNDEIVCTDARFMFWINSITGKITRFSPVSSSITAFPLSDNKAVVQSYQAGLHFVSIWDLKTPEVLSELPSLSSYSKKYMQYFAVGLLPNGNLVSIYDGHYLVITNLNTNQHEYVIDLETKIYSGDIYILEDGGIAVNYFTSLEIWR